MKPRDDLNQFKEEFSNPQKMGLTIERLVREGYLSKEKGCALNESLPEVIKKSEYALFNLGVHLSLGVIFAFDLIPLPLGTISRDIWVLGNRLYYEIARDGDKKKVHSLKVLFLSTIPFAGYFAYTLPLKEISEDATYLYANHVSYLRRGMSLEESLEKMPKAVNKLGRRILIPKHIREFGGGEEKRVDFGIDD